MYSKYYFFIPINESNQDKKSKNLDDLFLPQNRLEFLISSTHVIDIEFRIFSKKNNLNFSYSKNFILWAGHRKM